MRKHLTGKREEWLAARLELLKAEKDLTRRSDELNRENRERGFHARFSQTTQAKRKSHESRWKHRRSGYGGIQTPAARIELAGTI
jgi:hypothetical protein